MELGERDIDRLTFAVFRRFLPERATPRTRESGIALVSSSVMASTSALVPGLKSSTFA